MVAGVKLTRESFPYANYRIGWVEWDNSHSTLLVLKNDNMEVEEIWEHLYLD